ncbi:hypothetical protein [Allopontixanthobacter sp.]|uniref:DUF4139 domain-containing protein n=1 Tax=Allopontixanthobacter sp. TaxID=2906452 RepID=UPI002AB8BA29|nr:hypothetical protein [Allopontixanthobacter sp.]MDZ4306262.1 hypothetical protein [Allopontixanthobacter sp.]
MRPAALALIGILMGGTTAVPADAREVVSASAPVGLAVTIYRDPGRGEGDAMDRDWPQGFAMISETRDVTLPPGESTIRFEGVAEGMVAVSAIVTGLPGGTIEKNRNSDLLSPAAVVDGTLGNRVTITRTNPATGVTAAESAIISSRADGGLVLKTSGGYEAVRCSGLPEGLTFDAIPAGLSAKPMFSIDTRDENGGTYRVTLTYLAWGFDWQAHYVATLDDPAVPGEQRIKLLSWLTILNDNNQSFADAELMAVAGTLNIISDIQNLAEPPTGQPLRLMCYPLGSTAAGSPIAVPPPPPMPLPSAPAMVIMDDAIMVTGSRMKVQETPIAVTAVEEQLGDLKLYRVPERMTIAAKGLKQVAFLQRNAVKAELLYTGSCSAWDSAIGPVAAEIELTTKNDRDHGLGIALPMGGITIFEPSMAGDLLVGEEDLRDYAVGQDVEVYLGASNQVYVACKRLTGSPPDENPRKWAQMQSTVTNANPFPVRIRLDLGWTADWELRKTPGLKTKDGEHVLEMAIPANASRTLDWKLRPTASS